MPPRQGAAPARPGRPRREFTAAERTQAETLAGYGVPHRQICLTLGCDEKTLRRHLAAELAVGEAKATGLVAQTLFNKALKGDTIAMIFWLKCRAGWKDVPPVEVGGAGGGPVKIVYSWADAPPPK